MLPKKGREGLEGGLAETTEPQFMSGRGAPWKGSQVGSGDRDSVHPGPEELVLASHVLLPAFCRETLSTSVRIAPTPRGFSFSKA